MATREERFRGCLLGAAIGDALGAPRVGRTREEIGVEFYGCDFAAAPDVTAYTIPIGEFGEPERGLRLKPGQWTDDTQLMLALAETIMDEGGVLIPEAWAHRLVRWVLGEVRGPGLSTLQAALQLRTGAVEWDEAADPEGGGCGAATRVMPVALRYAGAGELRGIAAVTQAQMTHGDPDAQAAAFAVSEAIALALQTGQSANEESGVTNAHNGHDSANNAINQEEMAEIGAAENRAAAGSAGNGLAFLQTIRERVEAADGRFAEFGRCLALAERLLADGVPAADAIRVLGSSAWSREAVPCALYCAARWPDDFETPVCQAVTLTGDATDSLGTMVGAIAGARHGMEAIPEKWRDNVEGANLLVATADALFRLTQT